MRNRSLVSLLLLFAASAPAAGQSAFSDLVGKWSASGWLTEEPGAPMEPGRCRVRVENDKADAGITIRGRCAVAAGSATMVLRLVDDGGGRVRAGFASSAVNGAVQMSGTHADGTIHLSNSTPFLVDGELYDARGMIGFQNDNQFSVRNWNTPTGANQWRLVTDLTFFRQGGSE